MQRVKGAVLSDGPFHSIPMGRVRSYFVRAHEPKGAQREKNVFQNPRSPAIGITHFTAPLEGSFHDISTSSAIRLLDLGRTKTAFPPIGPADPFFAKPISIPELVAGIERICLRRQRPDDERLRLAPEPMKG